MTTVTPGTPFRAGPQGAAAAAHLPGSRRSRRLPDAQGAWRPVAALTVAALAVPSAMAYAELAGLSPVAGLYALLLPTVAYALLGSSRQLDRRPRGLALGARRRRGARARRGGQRRGGRARGDARAARRRVLPRRPARAARAGWPTTSPDPCSSATSTASPSCWSSASSAKLLGLDIDAADPLPQLVEMVASSATSSGATFAVGAGRARSSCCPLRYLTPRLPAAAARRRRRDRRLRGARPRGARASPSSATSRRACPS